MSSLKIFIQSSIASLLLIVFTHINAISSTPENLEQLKKELSVMKSNLFNYDRELYNKITFFVDEQLIKLDNETSNTDSPKIKLLTYLVEWQKNAMMRLALLALEQNHTKPLSSEDFLHSIVTIFYALSETYQIALIHIEKYCQDQTSCHQFIETMNQQMLTKNLTQLIVKYLPTSRQRYNELVATNFYQESPLLCNRYLELLYAQNGLTESSCIVNFFDEFIPFSQAIYKVLEEAKQEKNNFLKKQTSWHFWHNKRMIKTYDLFIDGLFKLLTEQQTIEQAQLQKKTYLLRVRNLICYDETFKRLTQQQKLSYHCFLFKKVIDDFINQTTSLPALLQNIYQLALQLQRIKKTYQASMVTKALFVQEHDDEYHLINMMLETLKNIITLEIKPALKEHDSYALFDQIFSEEWPDIHTTKKGIFATLAEVSNKIMGNKVGTITEKTLETITPLIASKVVEKVHSFLENEEETIKKNRQ